MFSLLMLGLISFGFLPFCVVNNPFWLSDTSTSKLWSDNQLTCHKEMTLQDMLQAPYLTHKMCVPYCPLKVTTWDQFRLYGWSATAKHSCLTLRPLTTSILVPPAAYVSCWGVEQRPWKEQIVRANGRFS